MAISLSLVTLNCTEIHLSGAPKLKSSLLRTLDSSSGMGVVIPPFHTYLNAFQ